MQDVQSVDERHYSLLQGVQCMVLRVVVSELVPQTPQCISEQLNLLRLLTGHKSTVTVTPPVLLRPQAFPKERIAVIMSEVL